MKKIFIISIALLFCLLNSEAQEKKALQVSDFDHWKSVSSPAISNNGIMVSFEVNPQDGDGVLHLENMETNDAKSFQRGTKARFSPQSSYLVFHITPQKDTVRALKLKKTKKDKMPKDTLGIFVFESKKYETISRLKSYKIPKDEGDWMAYMLYEDLKVKDTDTDDSSAENTKKNDKKKKKKDKNAPETYKLIIYNPVSGNQFEFQNITEYKIADNGQTIAFVRLQNDTLCRSKIIYFDTKKQTADSTDWTSGIIKKIAIDKKGEQMAYIYSSDTIKTKVYSLMYLKNKKITTVVDTLSNSLPEKWTVSEHGKIYFSDNAELLYFGAALRPLPEPKDTLLESEKVNIDIWNWKDPLLQPQQLKQLKREKNRSYLTVYHIKQNKVTQLESKDMKYVRTILKGNGNVAIGYNYNPYEKITSWETPSYKDIYSVDVQTGKRLLIREKIQSSISISAAGNYIIYYENADSSWYAFSLKNKTTAALTKSLNTNFYDDTYDYPNDPYHYGMAGWTENDKYVLIYDKYDIWQIDPTGIEKPINLTKNFGRENKMELRYIKLDPELEFIPVKENLLLRAFDNNTKDAGFFTTKIGSRKAPEKLIMSAHLYRNLEKAKDTDKLIWRRMNVNEYGDLHYSNIDFSETKQVSNANLQQKNFNWMTVEPVKWITTDGKESNGLIYKPENFDATKKYPMIVYFYRRHSDNINYHYTPSPSRSVINPVFYASNGYIVFMPDIFYKEGYPGESCFNHVVSGTLHVLSKGFVDKNRIGLQGQSWGGYQVAYLVTRTDMYAAASAGAPVTNMTSAYGGIRWGSGMSRMFQYEESQSRIGGTLWEKPLRYIENSPVFYADKVNTPLLMRHNDKDGAVPWYQGIEYFVALRRLNKPVWMLNYNKGPHNNTEKRSNQIDLSIRMKQFFDHYLNNKPAPVWMKHGIPATEKGKTMGYGFDEKQK